MALGSGKFLLLVASALFVSAGTLRFRGAWLYLALSFVWLTVAGAYLLRRDRALLERRLAGEKEGEKEGVQKVVIASLRILGLATLVVAGLDRRFGWSATPPALLAVGAFLFGAGAALIFLVFRENTYTSSIVEVEPQQTVVSTGPYQLLRHPMYTGTLLMGVATPLLLGSYWSAIFTPLGWALLVVRILAEERLLSQALRGYAAYMNRTRSRLIPGVW
jgi:protein-S-isoprenylcysteine O-methyltransferase Ste14